MPDTITKRAEFRVRLIFAEWNLIGCDVLVDLVPPNREQRTNNRERRFADLMGGNLTQRRQASCACTAKKINEKSLDQVVGVMGEKNGVAAAAGSDFCKERIARDPCGSL